MKRIALVHVLLIVALVAGFIIAMCCGAEARSPFRSQPIYIAQVPTAEHSVLVAACPGQDGTLTQWEKYIANKWDRVSDQECMRTCRTGWFTPTGEKIDLWMEFAKLAGGKRTSCEWEVARAYNWKNGLARSARIKERSGADEAGLILLVAKWADDRQAVIDARDACRAVGVRFKTCDMKGAVR